MRVMQALPARPGDSVEDLDTPTLIVDLDAFERNLDLMANAVRGAGIALRPHAKSHKCPEIALAPQTVGRTSGRAAAMARTSATVVTWVPNTSWKYTLIKRSAMCAVGR